MSRQFNSMNNLANRKIRTIFCCLSIILIFLLTSPLLPKQKWFINFNYNQWLPLDSNFKEIYGTNIHYPELKWGVSIYGDYYFWIGYGYFKRKGVTKPLLMEPTQINQTCVSFGLGFTEELINRFGYKIEFGFTNFILKEETFDIEVKHSKIGVRVEGGLVYRLINNIIIEFNVGYMRALKTIDLNNLKFGCLKFGISLGKRF